MQVESLPIEALIFDPSNARLHDNKNLDAIKGSLTKFGQRTPIVCDEKGVILKGNGTAAAAKALGWKKIFVVRVDDLNEVQKAAYAIADNRTSELASWNDDVLTKTLLALRDEDFDLPSIGFDDDDLAKLFGDNLPSPGEIEEDEVPTDVPERAKAGDVWQLGQHRLLCGDSTSPANIERLMQGEKCDLVFTDPPYRMITEGGEKGAVGKSIGKLADSIEHICDFDPVSFLGVLPSVFQKSRMNAYIFCNKDLVPDYLNWGQDEGYAFNILVWKKPNAIPLGSQHRPDLEYLLVFRKSAIWNNSLEGVNYSKCLEFARDSSTAHPTMKPLGLISNELFISSNPGSLVVDFFLGSGSTLIAAEKTGRRCYGFEMDPGYADIILQRWENATGGKVELLERDGEPSLAS